MPSLSTEVKQRLAAEYKAHSALMKTKGAALSAYAKDLWTEYKPTTVLGYTLLLFGTLTSVALGSVLLVTLFGLAVGLIWATAVASIILGSFATFALVLVTIGGLAAAWISGLAALVAGSGAFTLYLLQAAIRYYNAKTIQKANAASASSTALGSFALDVSKPATAADVASSKAAAAKHISLDQGLKAKA